MNNNVGPPFADHCNSHWDYHAFMTCRFPLPLFMWETVIRAEHLRSRSCWQYIVYLRKANATPVTQESCRQGIFRQLDFHILIWILLLQNALIPILCIACATRMANSHSYIADLAETPIEEVAEDGKSLSIRLLGLRVFSLHCYMSVRLSCIHTECECSGLLTEAC